MARTDPAYLMHFPGTSKADLMAEAEALGMKLAPYLHHLIETHPERAANKRKAKRGKKR